MIRQGPPHGRYVSQILESIVLRCPSGVEINDELIASERRYIAAASVADPTERPAELALPAAPRT